MTGLLALIGLIVGVAGGVALIPLWTRALADLLYMFVLRRLSVGFSVLFILLTVVLLVHLLGHFEAASPTAFLAGVILTPLAAQPMADFLTYRTANEATRRRIGTWRGFVFAERRCDLNDAYEAPPTIVDV